MAVSFSRTTRALDADRDHLPRAAIILALALIAIWTVWFIAGRIGVHAVSETARLEVVSASGQISALNGGRLALSHLRIGQAVKAGEILVELDARPQRLRLAEAEAQLAGMPRRIAALERQRAAMADAAAGYSRSSTAALEEARARLRGAEADATFSSDIARRQRNDSEAGGAAPVDAARAATEARKADALRDALDRERQRLAGETQSVRADRAVDAASIDVELARTISERDATQAQVTQLRTELEAQFVRAPFDGVIGDVATLRRGDVLAPGARLATIVPRGDLRIIATFDAARGVALLSAGQPARLRLDGFAWTQYGDVPARVDSVAAEAEGQTLRVELLPLQSMAGSLVLRHGMTGRIDVTVEEVTPFVLLLRTLGQWFG